jgi:excisionase family DNA binding protein
MTTDPLLTETETASYLHVPQRTLSQWRYLGRGPSYLKLGAHVRYRRSDLEAWLASGARAAS